MPQSFRFRHTRKLTGHIILRRLPSARIAYTAAVDVASLPPTVSNCMIKSPDLLEKLRLSHELRPALQDPTN